MPFAAADAAAGCEADHPTGVARTPHDLAQDPAA